MDNFFAFGPGVGSDMPRKFESYLVVQFPIKSKKIFINKLPERNEFSKAARFVSQQNNKGMEIYLSRATLRMAVGS